MSLVHVQLGRGGTVAVRQALQPWHSGWTSFTKWVMLFPRFQINRQKVLQGPVPTPFLQKSTKGYSSAHRQLSKYLTHSVGQANLAVKNSFAETFCTVSVAPVERPSKGDEKEKGMVLAGGLQPGG